MYHPTDNWWFLGTSWDGTSTVLAGTLLISLQNLCTLVNFDNTSFLPSGPVSRYFLQLLYSKASMICRPANIRVSDAHTYSFEASLAGHEALSIVNDWPSTNIGEFWQDRKTTTEHLVPSDGNQSTMQYAIQAWRKQSAI